MQIERLRVSVEAEDSNLGDFFLVVASNLLREFSLQEPADLRIRRRISANVTEPFVERFRKSAREAIRKLASAQAVVGMELRPGRAYLQDNRSLTAVEMPDRADAAITSPPYATALPYIDTQRLSLVWLGLIAPDRIAKVEADLTGSREMGTKAKRLGLDALQANRARLPEAEAAFCLELQSALSDNDGFRRQAVPLLLYRYFDQMAQTFRAVSSRLKPGAPFALIVGHNHMPDVGAVAPGAKTINGGYSALFSIGRSVIARVTAFAVGFVAASTVSSLSRLSSKSPKVRSGFKVGRMGGLPPAPDGFVGDGGLVARKMPSASSRATSSYDWITSNPGRSPLNQASVADAISERTF